MKNDFPCKDCKHLKKDHRKVKPMVCKLCGRGGVFEPNRLDVFLHEFVPDNLKYLEITNVRE